MKRSIHAVILLLALTGVYVVAQSTSNSGTTDQSTPNTMSSQGSSQSQTPSASSSESTQPSASQSSAETNADHGKSKKHEKAGASDKDDQQLLSQIQQQLSSDPAFKNVQASMTSKDIVVLNGTVANKADRKRAKDTVASIPGVKKVRDHISINASAGISASSNAPTTAGGTAGMASGSSSASSSSQNTAGSIAGNTKAGTAEGSSSTVGNSGAASATEQATPSASGSASAGSSSSGSAQQVQQKINQEISGSSVVVAQTSNNIVLTGTVSKEADRDRAESIARQLAPGITVVNQINVGTSSPMSSSSSAPTSSSASSQGSSAPDSSASSSPSASAGASSQGGVAGSASSTEPSASASGQSSSSNIGSSTASTGSTSPSGQATESAPSGAAQSGAAGSSSDLQSQIQKAMQDQNLSGINVNVTDTTIELSGSAATGKERREAMQIAQSYAGNRKVVDHITVSGRGQGANQGKSESGNPPMSETPTGSPSQNTGNPHY